MQLVNNKRYNNFRDINFPSNEVGISGVDHVRLVLANMSKFWDRRAQVKRDDPVLSLAFDVKKPDFLAELLPFHDHYLWQEASAEYQQKIFSYAWVLYNWKTIYIETDIVTPVCNDVLFGKLPGANDLITRSSIVQTLVDESYHNLMAMNACKIVLQGRQLPEISVPEFNLTKHMKQFSRIQDHNWQKQLVQYAVATVSETLISDYLKEISESNLIQPICKITTQAHRHDELAHSNIFSQILKSVFHALNDKQKYFLLSVMPKAVQWFADKELEVWCNVLKFVGFPRYQEMMSDVGATGSVDVNIIDYSGVISLLNKVDVDVNYETFLNLN